VKSSNLEEGRGVDGRKRKGTQFSKKCSERKQVRDAQVETPEAVHVNRFDQYECGRA
jgi:hypothetical protein